MRKSAKTQKPQKMKVVNESVKKTDKHDAATIAEFLEKDMLPGERAVAAVLKVRTSLVSLRD